MICLVVIPSWLLNFGAFIHIDENSIKAKYHWFGNVDCKLSDVSFAAARVNTLIIQLNDGKKHTITGVENAWPLCSMIRRNMRFDMTEQPKTLIKKLDDLKVSRKKGLIYVCAGVALMFIVIFITAFLTGEREMHEFNKTDWIIFAIMCGVEIAITVATFCFAKKTGKNDLLTEKLQYAIQRRIIETHPLLPGVVGAVYADEHYTRRFTLFGYPNNDSVYYTVQECALDYTFFKSYESEIFENVEQLADRFETLIDITDTVLH